MILGREVIPYLARIYKQLYLIPGSDGADDKYRAIVRRGEDLSEKTLAHFTMSDNDSLVITETPAGIVQVISLYERNDFEIFIQIMANRCKKKVIPRTQGAAIIDGVINWDKINAHKKEFLEKEIARGNYFPDWSAEFRRFTSNKCNYQDGIIVLSVGPYSGISASELGFSESEWIEFSAVIRKYHECTHFICRRLYPDQIDPIWDEVVADAVGIFAAFGRYDSDMALKFLGVDESGYKGGRLEIYLKEGIEERSKNFELDRMSKLVRTYVKLFSKIINESGNNNPFEILKLLECNYELYRVYP